MGRNIYQNAENINLAKARADRPLRTLSLPMGGRLSVTGAVGMPVTALSRCSPQLPEFEGGNCYKARSGPPLPFLRWATPGYAAQRRSAQG
jgi:hypothetical protein